MAVDIRSLMAEKREKKTYAKKLVIKDINSDLITSLLAMSVYGKDSRDEEIMRIIINGGKAVADRSQHEYLVKKFDERMKNKEYRKTKNGVVNKDGFTVLVPR